MKKSYYEDLALPKGIIFKGNLQEDNEVNEEQVEAFVNGLKRPTWYVCKGNADKDTREWVLQNLDRIKCVTTKTTDPFKNQLRVEYQCSDCEWATTYSGIDIGHKNDWRKELIFAGVQNKSEARAAYNNLNNLRIECATCNRSHDFEDMSGGESEYEDDSFVDNNG
jgi:hypothetical protein